MGYFTRLDFAASDERETKRNNDNPNAPTRTGIAAAGLAPAT